MDENQGTPEEVVRPSSEEKLAEMKQEAETLAERSKTVSERLENITTQPETPPEPMPSSNRTEVVEGESPEQQPTLPDNASDRTKEQFEKILAENKRLKEERRKEAGTSVFDSLRTPQAPVVDMSQFGNLNPQQTQQLTQQFVDAQGNVDIDGLNKALTSANDRAMVAETEARMARQSVQAIDERQQVREAHRDFPELDPQAESFDPNFYDLVTVKLAKSGMKMTLAEAAQAVKQTYTPSSFNPDRIRDDAVNQYKQSLAKRDQGPLSSGAGEPRSSEPVSELREKTRRGDPFALDERLRKLGLIK